MIPLKTGYGKYLTTLGKSKYWPPKIRLRASAVVAIYHGTDLSGCTTLPFSQISRYSQFPCLFLLFSWISARNFENSLRRVITYLPTCLLLLILPTNFVKFFPNLNTVKFPWSLVQVFLGDLLRVYSISFLKFFLPPCGKSTLPHYPHSRILKDCCEIWYVCYLAFCLEFSSVRFPKFRIEKKTH